MRVWTRAYRPFILGGNVHSPICTDVQSVRTIELHGVKLHLIRNPSGLQEVWAEDTTGGIVGNSLMEIERDLVEANPVVLEKQLVEMKALGKTATPVEAEVFWRMMR